MDSDESPEKNWTNFIDSGEFKAVLEPSWNVPPAGGEITRENPDIQLETVASTSGELLQQSLPRFESEVERKSSFLSSLSGISGGDLTKEFEVNLTENVKKRRVREDSENRQKKPKRENENSQEGPKGHTLEESTFLEVEKRELQATQRGEPLESSQKDHIPRRNFFSPGFLPERFGVSAEELQTFMAEQSSKILRPEETQRASGSRSIAGVSKETSRLEKLIPMPKLHRESTRSSGESLEVVLKERICFLQCFAVDHFFHSQYSLKNLPN